MTPIQPSVVLDPSTLAVIGALIGSLGGALGFLFRALIASKDAQIEAMKLSVAEQLAAARRETEAQRAVMLAEIQALKTDRDYFRSLAIAGERRGRGPA